MSHPTVPDPIFSEPRLAAVYDAFDGSRHDLDAYLAICSELSVSTILDVGCGTGSFALLASAAGFAVTGVDPARASVDIARAKVGADAVHWVVGSVDDAPPGPYDLAVMTGNVAQVFVDDAIWHETLLAIAGRLPSGGHLVFETRRPEARAWEAWAEPTSATAETAEGEVRQWLTLLDVPLPLVTFRWSYAFPDGSVLESDSTLRFRSDEENRASLARAGFETVDVRDAPDRPGLERVYLARRL